MADPKATRDTPTDAAAAPAGKPAKASAESKRDAATARAQQAELDRQEALREAVADAAPELETLGGPMMNPGLGR